MRNLSMLFNIVVFPGFVFTAAAGMLASAIDRKVNCDIVARSPYAVLFGVPVAAWGIFGYALAAVVVLWAARSRLRRSSR